MFLTGDNCNEEDTEKDKKDTDNSELSCNTFCLAGIHEAGFRW